MIHGICRWYGYVFFVALGSVFLEPTVNAQQKDIAQMAGWFDGIKDDKKYLSPFIGFIWWETGLIERYYRYGNIDVVMDKENFVVEKILGGDATIRLVHELFYAVGPNFDCTVDSTLPAQYFTAAVVGQILNSIELHRNDIDQLTQSLTGVIHKAIEASLLSKLSFFHRTVLTTDIQPELDRLQKLLVHDVLPVCDTYKNKPQFAGDIKNILSLFGYNQLNKFIWLSSIKNSKKGALNNLLRYLDEEDKKRLQPALSQLLDFYDRLNNKNEAMRADVFFEVPTVLERAHQRVQSLVDIIIGALKESGDCIGGDVILYPLHTPQAIFLSFLYQKVKSFDEFKIYSFQFNEPIIKENFDVYLNKRFDINDTTMIIDFDRLDIVGDIINNYESFAFASINKQFYQGNIPKFSNYENVKFYGDSFPNCVENAFLNWVKFIMAKLGLVNTQRRLYEADQLELKISTFMQKKGIKFDQSQLQLKTEPLRRFFKKYPNTTVISGTDLHQVWSELVSDVPGVKYLRRIRKDGSDFLKNNASPALHTSNGSEQPLSQDIPLDIKDDDWYLFELAGYPGAFVTLTNYLFGFSFKNFIEMCTTFDINVADADSPTALVTDVSDDETYTCLSKSAPVKKYLLTSEIDSKPIQLEIVAKTGHASLENRTQAKVAVSGYVALQTIIDNVLKYPNLLHLASLYTLRKSPISCISTANKLPVAYLQHLFLQSNLSDDQVCVQILSVADSMYNSFQPDSSVAHFMLKVVGHIITRNVVYTNDTLFIILMKSLCSKSIESIQAHEKFYSTLEGYIFKMMQSYKDLKGVIRLFCAMFLGPDFVVTYRSDRMSRRFLEVFEQILETQQNHPQVKNGRLLKAVQNSGVLFDDRTKVALINKLQKLAKPIQ